MEKLLEDMKTVSEFHRILWKKEQPTWAEREPNQYYQIAGRSNNSFGNRWQDSESLSYTKNYREDLDGYIDARRAGHEYLRLTGQVSTMFDLVQEGCIIGPRTKEAIGRMAVLTEERKAEGKKPHYYTVSKGAGMWEAMEEDVKNGEFFSDSFHYRSSSHRGWSRST